MQLLAPSDTSRDLVKPLLLLLVVLVLGALQKPQPGGVDQVRQLVKVKGQRVVVPEQDDAMAGLRIFEQVGAYTPRQQQQHWLSHTYIHASGSVGVQTVV